MPDDGPGERLLIRLALSRATVTRARHEVAGCAAAAGLAGQALDDFVLAVNELATNAVRHGGGTGVLTLWRTGRGELACEISDGGTGIPASRLAEHDRPAPSATGGWGLWLARRLCDDVAIETGNGGTVVRVTTRIGAP